MDNRKVQADKLLYDFGLLEKLKAFGTPYIVGSYSMDLMAWNDLDIYVSNESMSKEKLYELTSVIIKTYKPVWYEAKEEMNNSDKVWFHGFETEILGELWNVDIWFFDGVTISKAVDFSNDIKNKLIDKPSCKDIVVKIKQSLIASGQYGFDKYSSIDVYRAVFEDKISRYDEFIEKYGEKK